MTEHQTLAPTELDDADLSAVAGGLQNVLVTSLDIPAPPPPPPPNSD